MLADATVNVAMPGEPFQELYPQTCTGTGSTRVCTCNAPSGQKCTIDAQISGRVLIGLGCWCVDPFADVDNNGIPDACEVRRRLQENQLYVVEITEELFPLAVADEEEETGCTSFFLFCWIGAFLEWLLSVLTFGLLG
jgi:hypothetical protein